MEKDTRRLEFFLRSLSLLALWMGTLILTIWLLGSMGFVFRGDQGVLDQLLKILAGQGPVSPGVPLAGLALFILGLWKYRKVWRHRRARVRLVEEEDDDEPRMNF